MLLAFDPGKRLSGAALFEGPGGPLVDAALIRGQGQGDDSGALWLTMIDALRSWVGGRAVTHVAVERMVARQGFAVAVPALLELQAITGAVLGVYGRAGSCCALAPEDWKGQLDKRTHHTRLLGKLTDAELETLARVMDVEAYRAALLRDGDLPEAHNLLDAVGIGASRAVQYALLGDVAAHRVATPAPGAIQKTSSGMSFIVWGT